MDYIINPNWFYWLQVIEGVRLGALLFGIVLGLAGAVFVWQAYESEKYHDETDECLYYRKKSLLFLIPAAICLLVALFLPSKQTLIAMMIAKQATYTNAALTVEAVKEAVDYIVQAIKMI